MALIHPELVKLLTLKEHHETAMEKLRTLFPPTHVWTTEELIQTESYQLEVVNRLIKNLLQNKEQV